MDFKFNDISVHNWQCEICEFKPDISMDVLYFPGPTKDGGGYGHLLKITTKTGKIWFGFFSGYNGDNFGLADSTYNNVMNVGCGVYSGLNPDQMWVVLHEIIYIINANDPMAKSIFFEEYTIYYYPKKEILLLIDYSYFNVVDKNGHKWAVGASNSDCNVESIDENVIRIKAFGAGVENVPSIIDLETGTEFTPPHMRFLNKKWLYR